MRIFADRGYDSNAIFNHFGSSNINTAGEECLHRIRGPPARTRIFRLIKKNSQKELKDCGQYEKRCNVVVYFSGLKRIMGKIIKALKPEYIVQQIVMNAQYCNIMRRMTHAY